MADQADVRVRLSAEGTAEVIAAFQQVASEAKKSGKDASGAFAGVSKQFDEIGKKLAGFVSIALAADAFGEFFKSTLEAADAMETLSRQTGVSTTAIQAYSRAARDAGISQDAVNSGLARFTTAVGRAEIGTKQSAGALGDLGISIKDLSGQTADQQLLLVAQRLAAIQDPARRARDEVALFGRSGVELDQVLVKVGQEGLEPFVAELQRLGLFLDTQTLASLEAAQRSFRDMHDEVKGLATEFIIGLAPGLQVATDQFVRLTNSGDVSFFQKLGAGLGSFIQVLVGTIANATADISALITEAQIRFTSYASASANVLKGNFLQAVQDVRNASEQIAAIEDERQRKVAQNNLAALSAPGDSPKASSSASGGSGPAPEQQQALLHAKLQLTEAYLDNELSLYKAQAQLVESADKAAYEAGTLSLTDYYAQRAQIINNEIDKEVATVQAKRAAVAAAPVGLNDDTARTQQQTELVRLDGQLGQLQLQRASLLIANTNEQADAQRKLYADMLKAEQTLLTIEGRRADAARVKLAADLADLDQQLRKGGVSDADRGAAEGQFVTQGNAQIDFTDQVAKAQAALASLETARKAIQDQVTSGESFSIAAAQQILSLDRERLPALQAQAQALLDLAKATGSADDVSKAEAYKQKIDELTASTKLLAQQTAELRQGVENAIGAGITKFFQDAEEGSKGFKNAFHDMAAAIENDLLSIANKILEQTVLQAIFGGATPGNSGTSPWSALLGLGGVLGGSSAGAAASSGGIGAFFSSLFGGGAGADFTPAELAAGATGGQIRGPGSSTSDSIPMWASDGEFIVNAKATQTPGILPLLQAINEGNMIHRAHGGLVNSLITPGPAAADDKNGRFTPGMLVTNNFHIQAPHGSISRPTQKQIGAQAYKSIARAHRANN